MIELGSRVLTCVVPALLIPYGCCCIQSIGEVGVVCGIDEDHDVVVKYSSQNRYCSHSAQCYSLVLCILEYKNNPEGLPWGPLGPPFELTL